MKKTIKTLLALTLIVTLFVPTTAFAATSNAKTLDKLKLSDIKKYDKPVPTNGKKKTKKQMDALVNALLEKSKWSGKGNTQYVYTLYFNIDTGENNGEIHEAVKTKAWGTSESMYIRTKYLKGTDENLTNKTENQVRTEDKKYVYHYAWIKGEKKGTRYKFKKDSGKSSALSTDGSTNINALSKSSDTNYRLYKDAKVLGQKCMVYGYDHNYGKNNGGGKSTFYFYFSRKTGQQVKYVEVYHDLKIIVTAINFDRKTVKKSAKFFKPPKNVKFKTVKQ